MITLPITIIITCSILINVMITITITNNCNLNFKSSTNNITNQKMTCSLLNIHVPGLQSFEEVASTCLLSEFTLLD